MKALSIVSQFFKAFADRDEALLKKLLKEDVRWNLPPGHPSSPNGPMVGFVAAFNYLEKISKLPFMVESVHASEDDRHAVDVHRVRDNGLTVLCVTFFTFEDGLIAEMHSFADQPQTWVSYLAENPAWSR